MKAKVNIELFDSTSMTRLEEVGFTTKLLQIYYEEAFKQLLKEICQTGLEYSLFVEIEDNTAN
jgi:hypothetical protein